MDAAIADRVRGDADDDSDVLGRLEALRTCIDRLQPAHRQLVDLRYHSGTPVKNIAAKLARSAASISMSLMRIREALQKCVQRRLETSRV